MAALVCALIAAVAAGGGAWSYLRLSEELVREEFGRQRASADAIASQFTGGLEGLRQDVAFLAAVPAVDGYLRARRAGGVDAIERRTEEQWRQLLVEIFEAKLRTKPQYFQIRIIGAENNGREIIRVERQGSEVAVVPDSLLQEKGQRPYFQEAMQSRPGSIYLSQIELNEERGKVTEPRIATLRAATVIPGPDGKPFGILVINKDLRPRFSQMAEASEGRQVRLFSERGEFVLHPDSSRAFGSQLGKHFGVADEFPDLRAALALGGDSQAVVHVPESGAKAVATLIGLHPDPDNASRYFGLLLSDDYTAVIAPSLQLRSQIVLFVCLLLPATVGTVLLVSRLLTRPLRQITEAVHAFSHGGANLSLPLQAGDEAGVLARAFDGMMHEVRRHRAELEAEVAERRRAEMAWRESEQRLRLALDAAQAGVWEWNVETGQYLWDKTIRDAVTPGPEDAPVTSADWLALVHPDDKDLVPAQRKRAIEENRPYAVDFRIRSPKGGWRYRRARGVVVRSDDGRPLKLIGISSDVTEERLAQAAQQESAERLRLALGAAQAGAWEWDMRTDQTVWDKSIEDMAGFDPAAFPGGISSWVDLMHPEDKNNVPEARRRAVEENKPFEAEFRIRGRKGDWRHWNTRGILVRDEDGQPLKLTGISWDVTESKQAQERIREYATELERKNREMEQFVYSVSHDLKSPLVTCKGFTGILREDLAEGRIEGALDSAARLERATQHMGRLIEDLLQLSRVGRVVGKPEVVDVAALVSELAETLREQFNGQNVTVEIDEEIPRIVADALAVSRLFQNLLANAFRYGCRVPQPRIQVGGRIRGSEVWFFVRDNGPGIAAEYHEKVFGMFQRLEANQEGTGIGLAVVSKIMEVHGGRAWVESELGHGAAFWMAFPSTVLADAPSTLARISL
jgi:PAS domain S-box-containing protein